MTFFRRLAEKDEKRFFWWVVVPLQSFLLTSYGTVLYGFNSLIGATNEIFVPDHPTSGWVGATAGGLILFGGGFGSLFTASLVRLLGSMTRAWVFLNLLSFLVFAVGAFASHQDLVWLFLLGFAFPIGLVFGSLFAVSISQMVGWAKRAERTGLQSGMIGLAFGLWGSVYSFAGVHFGDRFGLGGALLISGGFIVVVGALGLALIVPPPASRKGGKVEAPTRSLGEVFRMPQYWLFSLFFLLFLIPGFGFKIIVQTLSVEVFNATATVSATMAFAFLFSYGIGRLIFGILADRVSVRLLYLSFLSVQIVVLVVAALLVRDQGGVVLFSTMMCVVGATFAGGKCIWMVALLKIHGAANFDHASHATMPAYGIAGFVGPFTLNIALQQSNVAVATSNWLLIMAGGLFLCFPLFLAIRPVKDG